jgi:hypothetical protein
MERQTKRAVQSHNQVQGIGETLNGRTIRGINHDRNEFSPTGGKRGFGHLSQKLF